VFQSRSRLACRTVGDYDSVSRTLNLRVRQPVLSTVSPWGVAGQPGLSLMPKQSASSGRCAKLSQVLVFFKSIVRAPRRKARSHDEFKMGLLIWFITVGCPADRTLELSFTPTGLAHGSMVQRKCSSKMVEGGGNAGCPRGLTAPDRGFDL
jgi:hypothetical protein